MQALRPEALGASLLGGFDAPLIARLLGLCGGDRLVLPDGAVHGLVARALGRTTVPSARAAFLLRRAAWEAIVSLRALDHQVREYAGSDTEAAAPGVVQGGWR